MDNNRFEEGYNSPSPVAENTLAANERTAWRTFLRVGLSLASFALLPQLVATVISLVCGIAGVDPSFFESDLYIYSVQVIAVYVIGIPVSFLVLGWPKAHPLAEMPLSSAVKPLRMTPLVLLILFCIAEFVSVSGSLIGNALMAIVGALSGSQQENGLTSLLGSSSPLAVFLVVVVIGPIMEELFFRYGVTRRLLPYGEKSAILLSGIFFGLAHGNFYQLFYTFAIGALFSFVYIRTGKLLYPIVFHMVFNFMGGFLPPLLMGMLPPDFLAGELTLGSLEALLPYLLPLLLFLGYTAFVYLAAAAGLVLFCIFFPKQRFAPAVLPIRKERAGRILLLNPGTITLILVSLLMFTISLIL